MNIAKKLSITAVVSLSALIFFTSNIANAESNPFSTPELVTIVADKVDGKCGEGKCGESKAKSSTKAKCGEGKCGESKAKSSAKAKCGEGKCGESKK